ncbi:MFS transporter [Streptomyces sp. V3I7]|uniref:MFS transporter n=1 Tax=Streptomyces sp. V3I7 TaxID=3042278 RepID=UPI0027804C0B|nr:MFS transporter [Streptomyces sp. V3I7]MDQ0993865.1 MHS family proline/betaine transporter-like MFS transporter [Streptomyces sp. V3I7]
MAYRIRAEVPQGDARAAGSGRDNRRGPIVAAAIGNFVEWYDYAVYGTLAVVLATLFFPKQDETAAILLTYTGYAVASVLRPAGALLFGALGDRIGRKSTLSAVVLLMSVSTAAIGLLPTYSGIGVWAPILLFVCRAFQGLSAGGEYGGSATFLSEYAPSGKRGLYTSWQTFTVLLSFLVGALLGALLTRGLGQEVLLSWAWRIPFLVALPLGLVGLYLRLRLEDTPAFAELKSQQDVTRSPLREAARDHKAALARVCGLAFFGTAATFVFLTYSTTYVVVNLKKSLDLGLIGLSAGLVVGMALCPFVGMAADRWGRRPVTLWSTIGILALVYPGFLLMGARSDAAIIGGYVLFTVLLTLYTGAAPAVLTEAFPTRVRYSGLSMSYSVAGSLTGLATPFALEWLIEHAGSASGPALWVLFTGVAGLTAAILLPETRGQDLA